MSEEVDFVDNLDELMRMADEEDARKASDDNIDELLRMAAEDDAKDKAASEEKASEDNVDELLRMAAEDDAKDKAASEEKASEDNIDELLRMAEEDAKNSKKVTSQDEERIEGQYYSHIFNNPSQPRPTRRKKPTPPSSPPKKDLKDLKFEDLFGSPAKKKNKTENHESKRRSIRSPDRFKALDEPVPAKKIPGGLDTCQLVIDPYSRIRLYKTSISLYYDATMTPEAALGDRNIGLHFVNLLSFNIWYRTKGMDHKNFWTSGVLTRKLPGVRKSSKGNDYVIWEINDLKELEKSWTVFLFGSAGTSSSLTYLPVGSVIDLTTPSVMDSGDLKYKFSVNNSNQIRHIATAKDFGHCQAKRKDGQDCTAVVNTWECCVCIHHASSELRKLGSKKSSKGNGKSNSFNKNPPFHHKSNFDPQKEGVVTINYGKSQIQSQGFSKAAPVLPYASVSGKTNYARMELQGSSSSICGELKRNTLSLGNASNISFKQEKHEFLVKEPPKAPAAKKPVNLDPMKTRHLTEKDRSILSALGGDKAQSFNNEIASRIASNSTAATRNYMRYLNVKDQKPNQRDKELDPGAEVKPISVTRETIKSMKKALDFIKSNGPIKKLDPNAISKRKSMPVDFKERIATGSTSSSGSSRKRKLEVEVEFDFDSDAFKKILNAKSAHEEHLADVQQEDYFDKLSQKEAIENKLLNTFAIATTAVMCRQCKYIALSQSDFCKGLAHPIRIVKATKRFFKCKDCGNRTMSLDRLPKHPCKNCNSSSWLSAAVGKERKGPVLPNEVLAIRGHEEKFIGAASSKMFLNLEVA